jgi:hypothetical protein
MKQLITILLLLSLVFFSCSKKYPEDGFYYMGKSPYKRIMGKWLLSKYTVNNADSTTSVFKKYVGWNAYGYGGNPGNPPPYQYGVIKFEISGDDGDANLYHYAVYDLGAGGEFQFINEEDNMNIFFGFAYGSKAPLLSPAFRSFPNPRDYLVWKIEKLTNINFKVSTTLNDTAYTLEFAKL